MLTLYGLESYLYEPERMQGPNRVPDESEGFVTDNASIRSGFQLYAASHRSMPFIGYVYDPQVNVSPASRMDPAPSSRRKDSAYMLRISAAVYAVPFTVLTAETTESMPSRLLCAIAEIKDAPPKLRAAHAPNA